MSRKQSGAGGLFAVALTLTGCGTYMERGGSAHIGYPDTYYKGTQASVKVLTFGGQGYDGYTSMFCWLSIVCPVAMIATLPVDVVVDTVLLPVDHYRYKSRLDSYSPAPKRDQPATLAEGSDSPAAPAEAR
ncbi:hypothetical protein [Geopseudomonas aromaticivorans]